jgi:hypothetical protein
VVAAGAHLCGVAGDLHARPGRWSIRVKGGSGDIIWDQVISRACPRAAAPSVMPVSRIARRPLLFQVPLKSPTTSRPAGPCSWIALRIA